MLFPRTGFLSGLRREALRQTSVLGIQTSAAGTTRCNRDRHVPKHAATLVNCGWYSQNSLLLAAYQQFLPIGKTSFT
jgi:1,6-anhydro-N-acetylmuramate kinase